jgi:hypothetical protein
VQTFAYNHDNELGLVVTPATLLDMLTNNRHPLKIRHCCE